MKTDGAQQKQSCTDRGRYADRWPCQAGQHACDSGEFERADHPPLHRVDAEVIADLQRLRNANHLDQAGESQQCGDAQHAVDRQGGVRAAPAACPSAIHHANVRFGIHPSQAHFNLRLLRDLICHVKNLFLARHVPLFAGA